MNKKEILIGLGLALLLAALLSPFASGLPDGFEWTLEVKGFMDKLILETRLNSPIPDYLFPAIQNEAVATSVAGIIGTLIVFVLGWSIAKVITRAKKV